MDGFIIWITGMSGSGKTTIANLVADELRTRGMPAVVIDGDDLRRRFDDGLGFSKDDRVTQARRLTAFSCLLAENGIVPICAAVTPLAKSRDDARAKLGEFVEVYLKCDESTCSGREEKKLYSKYEQGEVRNLAGKDFEFEEPEAADVVCDTADLDAEESKQKVVKKLETMGLLSVTEVDDGYSDEEEKKVEDRLRSLGYIE